MSSGYSSGNKRPMDNNGPSDPKRARTTPQSSRVVFVRGLPSDCLESELLALCCPFAVVEKSLLIPPKNQAFVQLPDVTSATNLITFYQTRDAMIRGKKVFFEYSTRDEITSRHDLDSAHNGSQRQDSRHEPRHEPRNDYAPASRAAPQQHQQPPPQQQQYAYAVQPPTAQSAPPQTGEPQRRGGAGSPTMILMVSVTKIEYDVTVDVLQQVFQKFGNVQKVVTFWKNGEFKALIQMESVDQAQAAQAALDGRDIYTGCNTLHVVFSRHSELSVRFNNERSRDFTNPNLPTGSAADLSADHGYDVEPPEQVYAQPPHADAHPQSAGPPPSTAPYHQGPPPAYGDRDSDRYRPDPQGPPPGRHPEYDYPPLHTGDVASMRQLPPHSTGRSIRTDNHRSCVLICSSMDSRLVSPERLFTFFGCFGDVLRVKIMFRKQDTALIQFVDDVHATSALDHLDGVVVYGKKLRVDYSKHTTVSMPRGDVDRFELENTQDFSSSPLHRYRRRSTSEAVPPCPLLHISGIPLQLQRDQNELVGLFAEYGYVKDFHYLQKNSKMAIVEMGSMDEAITALLYLDNLTYPDSHMRVSFSKAFQFTNGPSPHGTAPPMHLPSPTAGGYGGYPSGGPGGYPSGGGGGYGREPPRGRDRSRSRDRGGPPPMARDRSRERDRSRDRDRGRDRGGFRDRGGPGPRGGPPMGRDNYGRPPPPRRY